MKEFLPDLIARAKEGAELDVVHVKDEIRKEIESTDGVSRKFLELLEVFGDIIPEEKQRYNAAIRALSAASGLSRQTVLESATNQLEELEKLERGILSAFHGIRDEIIVMESRSQEIKSEIVRLREKIVQLEKEEQEILDNTAARERMKDVEEAVGQLFSDIRVEVAGIIKKIEEFTSEKVSPRPMSTPVSVRSYTHAEEKGGNEEKVKTSETSTPQETEFLRKCPMCGGQIHFLIKEAMWKCYTCGHEESAIDETEGAAASTAESVSMPEPLNLAGSAFTPEDMLTPVATPMESAPSEKKPLRKKKTCPACRRQMDWYEKEKSWLCPFCDRRRRVF